MLKATFYSAKKNWKGRQKCLSTLYYPHAIPGDVLADCRMQANVMQQKKPVSRIAAAAGYPPRQLGISLIDSVLKLSANTLHTLGTLQYLRRDQGITLHLPIGQLSEGRGDHIDEILEILNAIAVILRRQRTDLELHPKL